MPEPPFAVYYFTVGNVDFPVANRAILVELAHFYPLLRGGTRINALVVCHADCCFLLDRFGLRPTAMRGVTQANSQRAEQPAAAGGAGAFPYDHVYRAPAEAHRKAPASCCCCCPERTLSPVRCSRPPDGTGLYPGRRAGLPNSFPRQDTPAPTGLPRSTGCWTPPGNRAGRPAGKQYAVPWHADLPPMTGVAPLRNKATPFHRYQH